MRILFPASFYVRGGVERVLLSLVQEFDHLVEQVVVMLPSEALIAEVKAKLPNTHKVVYELSAWPATSLPAKQVTGLKRFKAWAERWDQPEFKRWCQRKTRKIKIYDRLRHLVQRHQITHCLYVMANRMPFPQELGVPVAMVSHDLFWHFAPLTYPEDLMQKYDRSLHQWLQQCDQVIAVSHKTRRDLLSTCPGFEDKVVTIPSASDRPAGDAAPRDTALTLLAQQGVPPDERPTFFFPSSFSLYKDHLTLLRAGVQLYGQGQSLKFLLTGRDTDRLIHNPSDLNSQKQTQEYEDYGAALQALKTEAGDGWDKIGFGLGYCDLAVVEAAYATCDCVVMPSRYEGFGLAIAEAVVRGIPVIAADLDVFREQVDIYRCEDRIRFFPAGDAVGLAACLEEFIANPIPRLSPAEAAERFDHWTWRHVAEAYLEVLAKL
jgi:glycosyltransferase involved in cell wall biosynthesis